MDGEPTPGKIQTTETQKPGDSSRQDQSPSRFARLRSIRDTLLRRNRQPAQDIQTRSKEVPINADSPVDAVWRNAEHDAPVRVTGSMGPGPDGREYVSIEGSTSGIPRDEIDFGSTQEKPQKPNFESQFSNRQSLKTQEGNLTFVDIKPEAEAQDNTPILVLPGWGITLKTEKPLLKALHDSGKPTIAVEIPRFGGKAVGKDEIPAEIVRQAELIAKKISHLPEGAKIDIVGQSMATMSLLAAAKVQPEILSKIRNVVLVSPAGISGNDNFAKLASRYLAQHVPQDTAYLLRGKWNIAVMSAEAGRYMRNPVRTLKEAVAISQSEDYDALQILQDNGVKVALMQGQSDKLTPTDKLWGKIVKDAPPVLEKTGETSSGYKLKEQEQQDRGPFDVITMVSGGHDNRIYADSEKFSRQILKRLDYLNNPTPRVDQIEASKKYLEKKLPKTKSYQKFLQNNKKTPKTDAATNENQQEKTKLQKFLIGTEKATNYIIGGYFRYTGGFLPGRFGRQVRAGGREQMNKHPHEEQIRKIDESLKSKLSKLKVFGQPIPDVLVGAVTSSTAKWATRGGLMIAGVGGLPAFAIAGAAGGSVSGGGREYLRQRREIKQKDSEHLAQIRSKLKRELYTLKAADKKRIRNAALRGSAYGAVGGVIGATIIDSIIHSDQVQDVAGKAASYIRENAPSAAGFIKDRAVQGAGLVKDKAGPKLEALGNWAEPVTKPIQEKAGPKIEAIGDTVGPIARDIQQRSSRAYEAFTEKPIPVAGVKIEAPGTTPEIKTPPVATLESITPPVLPKLPYGLESVNLESGSNPWNKVNGYLTENLGRQPTNREMQEAVARVLTDNNITDATKIPAGTTLKLSGVNEYLNQITSGRGLLTPELTISPDTISLPAGSNPWNEVSKYLEDGLGRPPTNAEVLEVTKAVARASDIKVPVWGIDGNNLDTQLQPGYKLNFNDEVKAQIQKISVKKPDILTSKPSIDITPTPQGAPMPPDITGTPAPPLGEVTPGPSTIPTEVAPSISPTPERLPTPSPTETTQLPKPTSTPAENLPSTRPKPVRLPTPKAAALPGSDSIADKVSQAAAQIATETSAFNPVEKISLSGSLNSLAGVQEYVSGYMEQGLGRKATGPELAKAIARMFSDNQITDSVNLPVGAEIRLTGVNNLIQDISKPKAS